MKCPVDGATLTMAERHNVEIDYCPDCRGIWLDRGELDQIIANASKVAAPGHDDDGTQGRGKRKRRFSMLTDMLGGGED